jgi:hypothetical protein
MRCIRRHYTGTTMVVRSRELCHERHEGVRRAPHNRLIGILGARGSSPCIALLPFEYSTVRIVAQHACVLGGSTPRGVFAILLEAGRRDDDDRSGERDERR